MYIDYAELQAIRHIPMKMADWVEKLNAFLKFSEYDILNNAGKVSHEVAVALAAQEYEKFRVIQDANYISDFDRELEKLEKQLERKLIWKLKIGLILQQLFYLQYLRL